MSRYENRMDDEIVMVDPAELTPHPNNWRLHGDRQRESVDAALSNIGTIAPITVNRRTGRVIDGHLRLELALEHGEPAVPVSYVDLNEADEAAALATFDTLARLAHEDEAQLGATIELANLDWADDLGIGDLLASLAPIDLETNQAVPLPLAVEGIEEPEIVPVPDRMKALRRYGGKGRALNRLLPLLDVPDVDTFIDGFGGAGHVLLNREPAKNEILNDLDGDVVNYFRMLRDRGDELRDGLTLTPYSRAEHDAAADRGPDVDELERARRFAIASFASIGAIPDSTFAHAANSPTSHALSWKNMVDALDRVTERLRGVAIEQRPAAKLLADGIAPSTLYYLDPPYMAETRQTSDNYVHEMTRADHVELLDVARSSPARIAISGYPHELYDEKLAGWRVVGWHTRTYADASRGPRGAAAIREERVWLNYNAQGVKIA